MIDVITLKVKDIIKQNFKVNYNCTKHFYAT